MRIFTYLDKLKEIAPGVYLMLLYLDKGLNEDSDMNEVLTPKVKEYLNEIGTPSKVIESLMTTDPSKICLQT